LSGVEYSQECYCDNAINPTALSAVGKCDWNCGGTINDNKLEICGGYGYVSIYNNTATAGEDPRLVPAAPKPSVGKYRYKGCLSDPNKVGGRALNGSQTRRVDMTNDACAKYCLGNFMHYSG
jgi:hypothetical protein